MSKKTIVMILSITCVVLLAAAAIILVLFMRSGVSSSGGGGGGGYSGNTRRDGASPGTFPGDPGASVPAFPGTVSETEESDESGEESDTSKESEETSEESEEISDESSDVSEESEENSDESSDGSEESEENSDESSRTSSEEESAETEKSEGSDEEIPDASEMSTDDSAGSKDAYGFSWEGGKPKWTNLSQNAVEIEDLKYLTGGWKATIITDPENERGICCADYMNINISGSDEAVNLTMKWDKRYFKNKGKTIDVGDKDSVLKGHYSGGEVSVTGAGNVLLDGFWYDGGKEYAVGTYVWPDGAVGYIALVRP